MFDNIDKLLFALTDCNIEAYLDYNNGKELVIPTHNANIRFEIENDTVKEIKIQTREV